MVEPKYEHDCDRCTFVGHLSGYDVYAPCDGSYHAWILRRSSEGSDYITTDALDRYVSPEPVDEGKAWREQVLAEGTLKDDPLEDFLRDDIFTKEAE